MNKYEQLIEHIINDETDKARELFHTIVVEKSRDIYESLIDEQDLAEVGGNEVEDLVDEVTIDEQGISEEEEGEEEEGEEGSEEPALDAEEETGGEESSEEELEDRVVDLEDALDELKAEFDALMAGEEHSDEGMHGDDGAEESPEEFYEAEEEVVEEAKEEEVEETEEVDEDAEIVREYVEKAPAPTTSEEGSVNKSSTVAGKNDMGGSAANIATGKAEQNPDGTSPKAAVKAKGNLPHAGSYENVPGAKAGNAFAKKETAVKKEEAGVNKTTPVAK